MSLDNEPDYVFRDRFPDRGEIYHRFDKESRAVRKHIDATLDIAYGPHPRCRFDLFLGRKKAPLVVFVQGGYWQGLTKDRYSFVAAPLVQRGFNVSLLEYPLAPEARVAEINACILAGLGAMTEALAEMDSEPNAVILTGHSAGGHLATCAALDWGSRVPVICGLVPISGIFDLEPLLKTSLNAALRLDAASARERSPLRKPPVNVHTAAIVGASETKGFIRQSEQYIAHCNRLGQSKAQLVRIEGANHYSILLDFFQHDSIIVNKICEIVGLSE